MDAMYQMAEHSVLSRADTDSVEVTHFNERLIVNLRKQAIREAFDFYSSFFEVDKSGQDVDHLSEAYIKELHDAQALGLFAPGGIREKDHLNYWCLGRVFDPQCYIESGVYIGSSLHAFVRCPSLSRVIAFDPNIGQLKVPTQSIPGAELVEDRDFSEYQTTDLPSRTLAYFDDHINTAYRIIQAHRLGLRYVMFDDSTGFEGMVQRLYPAVPTIPMILHCDLLESGDELGWSFPNMSTKPAQPQGLFRRRPKSDPQAMRVTLRITDALLEDCRQAKSLIRRCIEIPNLGKFIPQSIPERLADATKYLLELSD